VVSEDHAVSLPRERVEEEEYKNTRTRLDNVYIHYAVTPKADGVDNEMLSGNRIFVRGLKA
jgi:hypothetical protein